MTYDTERGVRRYRRLIEELGREGKGKIHGWKSRVARQLGVDQSYISRLISGERASVGAETIDKAIDNLRIRREFFYDVREPSSYKDYLGAREPAWPAWKEFLEKNKVTEFERIAIAAMDEGFRSGLAEGKEPNRVFYESVLFALRKLLTPPQMEATVKRTNEVEASMTRKKRAPRRGE